MRSLQEAPARMQIQVCTSFRCHDGNRHEHSQTASCSFGLLTSTDPVWCVCFHFEFLIMHLPQSPGFLTDEKVQIVSRSRESYDLVC